MTTPVDTPLNPRLAEWISYAKAIRYQLLEFAQSLPESAYEQRSGPDGWTIAGILEHLALIEDSIGRLINRMSKQIRAEGHPVEIETTSILGLVDEMAADSRHRKMMAPEPYRPTGTVSVQQSLVRLEDIRQRLVSAVESANGVDLSKATFPHPFFGPLNGYEWLVWIPKHELRHLNQMKEILNAPRTTTESL
jgi:hypothetical protein